MTGLLFSATDSMPRFNTCHTLPLPGKKRPAALSKRRRNETISDGQADNSRGQHQCPDHYGIAPREAAAKNFSHDDKAYTADTFYEYKDTERQFGKQNAAGDENQGISQEKQVTGVFFDGIVVCEHHCYKAADHQQC